MNNLKKKYFFRHLYISLLIVLSISLACQHYWFPAPFLLLDGTWFAVLILAIVDIIIGPFLTLLLVHSKKSKIELRLDIAITLIIQLSALSYGLSKIYQERAFAIVYENGLFHPIPTKEIHPSSLTQKLDLPKYKNVYYAMIGKTDIQPEIVHRPSLYSPQKYKKVTREILQDQNLEYKSLPLEIKDKYDESHHFKILAGKSRVAIIIFNKNMEILDIEISPVLLKDNN